LSGDDIATVTEVDIHVVILETASEFSSVANHLSTRDSDEKETPSLKSETGNPPVKL